MWRGGLLVFVSISIYICLFIGLFICVFIYIGDFRNWQERGSEIGIILWVLIYLQVL